MISNKYGFIFIHVPKTGGTSVSHTLHTDTDQECEIVYEEEGDGIATIYPNQQDFPWWEAWIQVREKLEKSAVFASIPRILTYPSTAIFSGVSEIPHLGKGNIKHLPLIMWRHLMKDPRFHHYNTFLENYFIVATCRNPYAREFSCFLYESDLALKELERALKREGESNTEISERFKYLWLEWVSQNLNTEENAQYLWCTTKDRAPVFVIRLEHIEEDYNEFCNLLGIERKSAQIPHLLNKRSKWADYLPDNILEWYVGEPLQLIHYNRRRDFELLPYEKGKLE